MALTKSAQLPTQGLPPKAEVECYHLAERGGNLKSEPVILCM